eukprot:3736299-Pleurochrysis_carterae.AAC.1
MLVVRGTRDTLVDTRTRRVGGDENDAVTRPGGGMAGAAAGDVAASGRADTHGARYTAEAPAA